MNFVINKKVVIWSIIAAIIVIGLISGLIFGYRNSNDEKLQGAIVANGIECATIGRSILKKGGTAVDAAIAVLFCEGVTCPQSMGLGGGFFATIYRHSDRSVETLVARETAPLKSTENMFVNRSVEGALSVAVPGELKGYWSLHQQYGRLPWAQLVQPTIDLCRNGIEVSPYLHKSLKQYETWIKNDSLHMREIFINPKTNEVWNEGDLMLRQQFAKTLELIAKDGERAFYGGEIGKQLIEDIAELGGIITEEDLRQYEVRWKKPLKTKIQGGYTLYTTPLPGSGAVLTLILNLLDTLYTEDRSLYYQRIVESFKHAYGQRTNLGDDEFNDDMKVFIENISNPIFLKQLRNKIFDDRTFSSYTYYGANFSNVEDHGTANLAVLAPNGDAVTITSTINTIFGAKFRSKRTGIILNDEMDDFSTPGKPNYFGIPPSPANFIKPKKMPMSSMCPSIILDDKGHVRLLIGAAGGSKITSSVAQVMIKYLYFKEGLNEAVQSKRLHHQLAPMVLQHEENFDPNILNYLSNKVNHTLEKAAKGIGFSALTAIGALGDHVVPVYDFRRNGSTATYDEETKA